MKKLCMLLACSIVLLNGSIIAMDQLKTGQADEAQGNKQVQGQLVSEQAAAQQKPKPSTAHMQLAHRSSQPTSSYRAKNAATQAQKSGQSSPAASSGSATPASIPASPRHSVNLSAAASAVGQSVPTVANSSDSDLVAQMALLRTQLEKLEQEKKAEEQRRKQAEDQLTAEEAKRRDAEVKKKQAEDDKKQAEDNLSAERGAAEGRAAERARQAVADERVAAADIAKKALEEAARKAVEVERAEAADKAKKDLEAALANKLKEEEKKRDEQRRKDADVKANRLRTLLRGAEINDVGSGYAALHNAALREDIEAIEILLEAGARVDIQGQEGKTPLHLAAMNKKVRAIEILVQKGASVDVQDHFKNTPLHDAVNRHEQNCLVINCLIKHKASVDAINNDGLTPIQIAVQSCLENVRSLVSLGASLTVLDPDQNTLMHLAVLGRKVDIIRYLHALKFDVNAKNKNGYTPLLRALVKSDSNHIPLSPVISCLKELGASLEVTVTVNSTYDSNTPTVHLENISALHLAAFYNNTEAIDALVDVGFYLNFKATFDEKTALSVAAMNCNVDAMRCLIKRGADIEAKDKYGETALHYATKFKKYYAVDRLANEFKANVNAKTLLDRSSPLLNAISWNASIDIIKCLCEAGARPNEQDEKGHTALHLLMWNKMEAKEKEAVTQYLISKGANVNALSRKDAWDDMRFTPLDLATTSSKSAQRNELAIQVLKRHGAKEATNCVMM